MSDIKAWGVSESSSANQVASPNGWPDGQFPSTVKGTGREMMAAIRRQWNDQPWFDWGDSSAVNNLTFVSTTSFKMDGDSTGRYVVNRRLRIDDTSTLYGSVTDSTLASGNTTVTVVLDSGAITTSITAIALSNTTPLGLPPTVELGDNMLINGDFVVAQRGTAFTAATTPANSDTNYLLDRWRLLSNGNDILDVSQETTTANLPTGSRAAAKLLVATHDAQAGMATMLENKDSQHAVGGLVSFSFKAKSATYTKLDKLRAGIIGWSGTADTLPTDLVGATGWSGGEGVDPSLTANAAYQNTPSDLAISTGGYSTFQIEAVNVGAGVKNLGVFIWIDNADATVGEIAYITDCQLNIGGAVGKFDVKPIAEELGLCKRYYEKSFDQGTDPATNTTIAGAAIYHPLVALAGQKGLAVIDFNASKFKAPSVTLYNPKEADNDWYNYTDSVGGGSATATFITKERFVGEVTQVGQDGLGDSIFIHWDADAEI